MDYDSALIVPDYMMEWVNQLRESSGGAAAVKKLSVHELRMLSEYWRKQVERWEVEARLHAENASNHAEEKERWRERYRVVSANEHRLQNLVDKCLTPDLTCRHCHKSLAGKE